MNAGNHARNIRERVDRHHGAAGRQPAEVMPRSGCPQSLLPLIESLACVRALSDSSLGICKRAARRKLDQRREFAAIEPDAVS